MRDDQYDFKVGEKGQEGLDILDIMFNSHTQKHILQAGIQPGLRVLDIGCGRGAMSLWLAEQVGETGRVVAIDNSENQIKATIDLIKDKPDWLEFKIHSAFDLHELNEQFDMAYCRFTLHHLNNPTKVIEKVFNLLPKGGIFIVEEGIVSAAFAYPRTKAWGNERLEYPLEAEGEEDRDGNFGLKLFNRMVTVGFNVNYAGLFQPLLYTKEQKQLLAGSAREDYKQYALNHGIPLNEWEKRMLEMDRLIENDAGCIGFYQSCIVVGKKP